jgi:hypothetical protein
MKRGNQQTRSPRNPVRPMLAWIPALIIVALYPPT